MSNIANLSRRIQVLSASLIGETNEDERDKIQQEIEDLEEEIEEQTENSREHGRDSDWR